MSDTNRPTHGHLPVDAGARPFKTEEIAKLWMNENSVVNTKAAYFTAVNAALLVSLKAADRNVCPDLCCWFGGLPHRILVNLQDMRLPRDLSAHA